MTSYPPQPAAQPSGPDPQVPSVAPAKAPRRLQVSPKQILVLVILAIVLWFIFANTRSIVIRLWVKDVTAPLWLVLLCTLAAGVIVGWLLGRRRRRPA